MTPNFIIHPDGEAMLFEPPFALWKHKDIYCAVIRQMRTGCFAGYCGVEKPHPLWEGTTLDFDVHGGITYRSQRLPCVQPDLLPPLFWIGFDFAHFQLNDLRPIQSADRRGEQLLEEGAEFRSFNRVVQEVTKLTDLLIALNSPT